ncbi:regulatory protein RecX [Arcanobacterium pinnipediorum]|uniref:Regulatory protein RecX n=1 Tax=Arcanobacterium pinnipediorum TaxID=1503041 RepID=A0ABY5AJA3_9ACTO|nr:regulatory protein RecX [Arcanobacterium pinnipediorum]USR80008.1 recombination regulator RecX [Arcanobacterium pinnipediorum]
MVDYAHDADEKPLRRSYRSASEVAQRKIERARARSEEEWVQYAKDLCYRQLGMMERSVAQLRQSMERNLVPAHIVQSTLEAFIEADLVNDKRFAMMFVRSKFAEKTISRRGLHQELSRRGISPELARRALEQIDDEDERQAALEFARRKIRTMRTEEQHVAKRRLYSALARRGFCADHINHALSQALETLEIDI